MAVGSAKLGRGISAASAAVLALLLGIGASSSALSATFVVDSTADAIDNNLEDGLCAVEGGGCTLRAAVMQANALAGADVIDLTGINDPTNPILLSLSGDGPDEIWLESDGTEPYVVGGTPDASVGDLDILEDVTIQGAGPGLTVIGWAEGATADRIFHLQAPVDTTVALITISDLAVTGGSVGVENIEFIPDCGNPPAEPPDEGPPAPPTEGDWVLKRFGGGIAIGAGAGIGNTCKSGMDSGGDGGPPDGGDEEEEGGIEAVELTRLLVAGNSSESDAGGIHVAAPLTLSQSIIASSLSGGNGGGLYLDTESIIQDTTIGKVFDTATTSNLGIEDAALVALTGVGNHGENGGGIFDTGFHSSTIVNSAINGNTAIGGGAIASRALITTNITNTTISGNLASDVGGGITTNGKVNLVNVTVADNVATTDAAGGGGGLNSFGSGTFTLANTLISGNQMAGADAEARDQNCGCTGSETCDAGVFITRGGNLEDSTTCGLGIDDIVGVDPLIGPLAFNGGYTETHALPLPPVLDGTGSAAVDAGQAGLCPNNDQRGTLRADDGDLNQTFECDIGAFELFIPRADLHINNASVPSQVRKGEQFRLTVQVHNDFANTVAEQVRFQANVPAGLDLVSADWALAGGAITPCTIAGGSVACDIGDMPIAATADVWVDIASNGQTIYTGPPVTYDLPLAVQTVTTDLVPGNNLASPKVGVLGISDVEVTAVASATEVDATNPVTVSYTIVNNGEDFASGMHFGVLLPEGINVISATPDSGNCNTGGGSISCTFAGLGAGAGSLNIEVVFEPMIAGDLSITGEVQQDQFDANDANNVVSTAVTSIAIADLALSGSASRSRMYTGDNVTLSLTATNAGPLTAENLVITGSIPTGMSFVSGSGCAVASGTVSCEAASLASGDSTTFEVVLTATATGSKSSSLSLSSDTKDPVASNDSAAISFTITDRPSSSSGGCVSNPGSGFDPTLLVLLALSLAALATGCKRVRVE